MRAIRFERTGGPEVLQLVELPDPPRPAKGEILIRQHAVGVNFIDTYHRSGLYRVELPSGLGSEGAGEVVDIGPGVQRFAVGDRVAYAGGMIGSYAELATVKAARAVKLPEAISFELAAASLLKGMTAEFLLRRCYPVQPGQNVLVHAAAGGVGQILVQWASHLGAKVIGTAGSPEKARLARALGCTHVFGYGPEDDFPSNVARVTGAEGVQVAYDSVGASTFQGTLECLGRRGVFVSFGNSSGPPPPISPAELQRRGSLFITRPTLFDYIATTQELDASAGALFEMLASGKIKVEIGQTFPLAEAQRAHEALEARKTIGATLLIP